MRCLFVGVDARYANTSSLLQIASPVAVTFEASELRFIDAGSLAALLVVYGARSVIADSLIVQNCSAAGTLVSLGTVWNKQTAGPAVAVQTSLFSGAQSPLFITGTSASISNTSFVGGVKASPSKGLAVMNVPCESSVKITGSNFTDFATPSWNVSGIVVSSRTVAISNALFANNRIATGTLSVYGQRAHVSESVFQANLAKDTKGAALFLSSKVSCLVENCRFAQNEGGEGGAIYRNGS